MKIDSDKLEATIREVLAAMVPNQSAASSPAPAACPVPAPAQDEPTGDGVFADMDSAVEAAYRAQR